MFGPVRASRAVAMCDQGKRETGAPTMQWPHHVKVTYRNGEVWKNDYAEHDLAHRTAQKRSESPAVENATVTTVYQAGQYADSTEDTSGELAGPPQRCLNCGAREGQDCQSWCAFKPHGRPMTDVQAG